jgi:hypothetical protein
MEVALMWIDDLLGVTARLDNDQQLRGQAAEAVEGQVWTSRLQSRDSRGKRCVSWVVGQVTLAGNPQRGKVKRLGGQDLLESQALSRAGGARGPRLNGELSRGENGAPPRPPFASPEQFDAVPTGERVVVEYTRPGRHGVRFIEGGTCGYVQTLANGEVGRNVGRVWVPLERIVGMVRVETDQYEKFEVRAGYGAPTTTPEGIDAALARGRRYVAHTRPVSPTGEGLTSDTDLSSQGVRR